MFKIKYVSDFFLFEFFFLYVKLSCFKTVSLLKISYAWSILVWNVSLLFFASETFIEVIRIQKLCNKMSVSMSIIL